MNKLPTTTSTKSMTLRRLHALLRKLSGPGFTGVEDRHHAIRELRQSDPNQLFPLLVRLLNHRSLDVRCHAAEVILGIDKERGLEAVLPFLQDRSKTFRWSICGLLHDFGDIRAIPSLIERLKTDADPQIRNTAAYALGGIGSLQALRALKEAEENDHEYDIHGHSASSVSTDAISDILMKEAIRIVETYPETTITIEQELSTRIIVKVILQTTGQQYRDLSWEAWGPTTGCFRPPLQPLHDSPFTVDMRVKQEGIRVRRVFIFQMGETGWAISTVTKPDLADNQGPA